MKRRPLWMACALVFLIPLGAAAQESARISVQVRQVAGSNVYLNVGTRHGISTGDTLGVARDSLSLPLGYLFVIAAGEDRSLLGFAGDAFSLTRGEQLSLVLGASAQEPRALPSERSSGETAAARTTEALPAPSPPRPPAYGRLSFGASSTRSSTRFGGADAVRVRRTRATPSLRLDVTAPQALAGFTFRMSSRVAYRYSASGSLRPQSSARIYTASLGRQFDALGARVALGRLSSPVESFSGYWDGLFVRVGRDAFGGGAMVGFEPDRWNERPSAERPKATLFLDGAARGDGWRWSGDVSGHVVGSADSTTTHTFVGLSQRLSMGSVFVSQDLQLDRDPVVGGVRASRLRLRASLRVDSGLQLRGSFSKRETFRSRRVDDPFGPRSDRLSFGARFFGDRSTVTADLGITRDGRGQLSRGATASVWLARVRWFDAAFAMNASAWTGPYGSTFGATPQIRLDLGRGRLRAGYRVQLSDYLGSGTTTHGPEGFLDLPVRGGLRLSARAWVQWGRALDRQSLDITLSRIF